MKEVEAVQRKRENAIERKRENRTERGGRPREKRREKVGGGERDGDKERRVDDEGRRR